jgi:hypothetical protein
VGLSLLGLGLLVIVARGVVARFSARRFGTLLGRRRGRPLDRRYSHPIRLFGKRDQV